MLLRRPHIILYPHPHIVGAIRSLGHAASLKYPQAGRNLSDRYKRLERSLRGKKGSERKVTELASIAKTPSVTTPAHNTLRQQVEMFRGFEVPKEPRPPGDDECCMSNCAICVYDLYEDILEDYGTTVAALRTSLSSLNIPPSEWPKSIRTNIDLGSKGTGSRQQVVLNAFEEMERALQEKQQQQESRKESRNQDGSVDPVFADKLYSDPSGLASASKTRPFQLLSMQEPDNWQAGVIELPMGAVQQSETKGSRR